MKRVSEAIKNDAGEQNGRFHSMLLGTLGSSLLGNLLPGKSIIRVSEDMIRAGQDL